MSLPDLLSTPAPPHAFLVGPNRLAYASLLRRRTALGRVETLELDESWHRLGPVGLLHVDRQLLGGGLAGLQQRLGKLPGRASLVVPDEWVRSVLVETEGLPRRRQEAEEVVRWRLKKLLPCRPEEVRLDFLPTGVDGKTLVVLALDRPLATLEEAFLAVGVSLGRIEPLALALTGLLPPAQGLRLLVVLESRALGLVLLGRERLLLLRHKVLLGAREHAHAFLVRELARTLGHARQVEGAATPLEVLLMGSVQGLSETVESWAAAEQAVTVRRLALEGGPWPAVAGLEPIQLGAMLATAAEGEW